jgi:hypothetical protein
MIPETVTTHPEPSRPLTREEFDTIQPDTPIELLHGQEWCAAKVLGHVGPRIHAGLLAGDQIVGYLLSWIEAKGCLRFPAPPTIPPTERVMPLVPLPPVLDADTARRSWLNAVMSLGSERTEALRQMIAGAAMVVDSAGPDARRLAAALEAFDVPPGAHDLRNPRREA